MELDEDRPSHDLTRRLELPSDHVHRDAEAMEHALSDEAVDRMMFPRFSGSGERTLLAKGIAASPGAAHHTRAHVSASAGSRVASGAASVANTAGSSPVSERRRRSAAAVAARLVAGAGVEIAADTVP